MSWRKNGFSYIEWLVYTLLTGTALVALTCGTADGITAGTAGAAAILTAAGAAVFLLYRFAPCRTGGRGEKQTARNVAEAAAVVALLAVGLALRLKGLEGAGQTEAYFELAEVAPGKSIPQIAHGAVYFYVRFLHIVFYFLGNKFMAGIWAQLLLQFGAALLLYAAVRRLTGAAAALVTLSFLMCSPYMIRYALVLSPEMLYLFLFAAGLLWVSAYTVRLRVPDFLFLGALTAFLSFLDGMGLLLLFFAVAVIFSDRTEPSGRPERPAALLLCFLGFAAGFAVCICADAWCSGKGADGVFLAWLTLYRPEGFRLSLETAAEAGVWEGLLPVALMCFGIFSFWCDRKRDRMGAYILGLCLVLAASVSGVFTQEMPGNLYIFLLAVLLAGAGLEQCFRTSGGEAVPAEQETSSALGGESGGAAKPEPAKTVGGAAGGMGSPEAAGSGTAAAENHPPARKVNYIENPLPLPKKHERRVMDYRLKPEADRADFDIDVADDDDFDI